MNTRTPFTAPGEQALEIVTPAASEPASEPEPVAADREVEATSVADRAIEALAAIGTDEAKAFAFSITHSLRFLQPRAAVEGALAHARKATRFGGRKAAAHEPTVAALEAILSAAPTAPAVEDRRRQVIRSWACEAMVEDLAGASEEVITTAVDAFMVEAEPFVAGLDARRSDADLIQVIESNLLSDPHLKRAVAAAQKAIA